MSFDEEKPLLSTCAVASGSASSSAVPGPRVAVDCAQLSGDARTTVGRTRSDSLALTAEGDRRQYRLVYSIIMPCARLPCDFLALTLRSSGARRANGTVKNACLPLRLVYHPRTAV